MPAKPNGRKANICEQIITDPTTGLTVQFEVKKGIQGGQVVDETVMRLMGESLPFGNREIVFDENGKETAAGTAARGLCRPSWMTDVG